MMPTAGSQSQLIGTSQSTWKDSAGNVAEKAGEIGFATLNAW